MPASAPAASSTVIEAMPLTSPFTALRTMTTPPLGPGTEPLIEQQVALDVGLDDLEVERGDLLVAHVTGHLRGP